MSDQPRQGGRRQLDRAPGERFAAPSEGRSGPGVAASGRFSARARSVVAAVLLAHAGALLFFLLGLLDLGPGLALLAAFIGWVIGVALIWWGRATVAPRGRRLALAAGLGAWAIVLAMGVDWGYAQVQGGVLAPFDYVAARYGWWGMASIPVAAVVARLRAR